ncbi:hypothetical protein HPB47_010794 [Ixodes persulcatus]|uniref:Uncharacterized protein n=1 Tax=Ixodes persulcatus TaxID=34615 RepID=A0AC60NYA2_IXOPE|nr:hypothetical protein HPB47_010794 [Ixodes persulcatus]
MQVQHKTHRRSFHQSWCPSNKENCVPSSTVFGQTTDGRNYSSAGSSDGNLASEIVLSAARHAKNRRSTCNFKEQEVWKAAVNNVGLPRTSTETGQLPKLVDDRVRNTPLSLVNDSANITDKVTNGEAVQSWVLHHNPGGENCEDPCSSDDTGTSDDEDDQRILEEVIRKGMGMTPPIKLPVKLPRPVKMPRKFKPAEFFGGKGCAPARLRETCPLEDSGHQELPESGV